jgi:hypothetical protein
MSATQGYECALALRPLRLRESEDLHVKVPGELELQAQFYRGSLGWNWLSEDGVEIEVLQPGRWNHEPGPDFTGARIRFGDKEARGDIEIDPEAADWERHSHSINPAFDGVILHLFAKRPSRRFFTRTSKNREVAQVLLPVVADRPLLPNAKPGATLEQAEAFKLIEAAAGYRLHRKRRTFINSADRLGVEESLFHSLAEGMGYKNNKIPFLLVSERVGWERARKPEGESLLFGVAGFLAARDFDDAEEEEARECMRALWEQWWEVRDASARLVLPEDAWKFSAVRPANHPHRRMAALHKIAQILPRLQDATKAANADAFVRSLTGISHDFWNRHASVACERLARPIAMVGKDRALDLAINVLVPALEPERAWSVLRHLPSPAPSTKVIEAAEWLCGPQAKGLTRSGWMQQGLLQLHADFFGEDPRGVFCRVVETAGAS